VKWC